MSKMTNIEKLKIKAAKGRKFSEEHKKRLSEAHKKYHEQKQKSEV